MCVRCKTGCACAPVPSHTPILLSYYADVMALSETMGMRIACENKCWETVGCVVVLEAMRRRPAGSIVQQASWYVGSIGDGAMNGENSLKLCKIQRAFEFDAPLAEQECRAEYIPRVSRLKSSPETQRGQSHGIVSMHACFNRLVCGVSLHDIVARRCEYSLGVD